MKKILVFLLSAQIVQASEIKLHRMTFYVDPYLVTDHAVAQARLQKYVDDLNFILEKNTNRRLLLDHVKTEAFPAHGFYGGGVFPQEDFDILVQVRASQVWWTSYGGNVSFNEDGSGIMYNHCWLGIYDPDDVSICSDYTIQLEYLAHELAHVFGAGIGEYYSHAHIDDKTGSLPDLSMNISNYPNDPYWNISKSPYLKDPLLNPSQLIQREIKNRADLLEAMEYSPLTAAILNSGCRGVYLPTVPDLSCITIKVVDARNGMPMPGSAVRIWSRSSALDDVVVTDNLGTTSFSWKEFPFMDIFGLKMVKVSKGGYRPAGICISVFDLQEIKLLDGKDKAEFIIPLVPYIRDEIRKKEFLPTKKW
ncbi:MAG: hypothetical protein Q8Q03_01890 [bacterium]|nr:hypothetical protein [bacterium]